MARCLTFLIALLCLVTSVSAGILERTQAPSWVKDRPTPSVSNIGSSFIKRGTEDLLEDLQYMVHADSHVLYVRTTTAVSDRLGLENIGALTIDYDPAEETVRLHHAKIIRSGQAIELTDQLEFVDLRRETDLSRGILTGEMTLHTAIPDVRVGDVLDVAYSFERRRSIFPEHFHARFIDKPYRSIRSEYKRITFPKGRDFIVRGGPPNDYAQETDDTFTSIEWIRHDQHDAEPNLDVPDWVNPYGVVEISTFESWEKISSELAPHYQPATDLPSELVDWVAATMAGTTDEDKRITAALRFAQDRLRYVGIEIGQGGYIPRAPEIAMQRGYGDCKDKAVLMMSLLHAMGIRSNVVLVHSERGRALVDVLPSPYAFDHAIIEVHSSTGSYFLDPTDVLQGGIADNVALTDFVWALPLVTGGSNLVPVTRKSQTLPLREVEDTYTFSQADGVAADFAVVSTFRGHEADNMRWSLRSKGLETRSEQYLDYYDGRFPGITMTTPIHFEDDLDANIVRLFEYYEIPEKGFTEKGLWKKFWLNPYIIYGELPELDEDEPRTTALQLDPELHNRHSVTLRNVPQPLSAPDDIIRNDEFVNFSRIGRFDESTQSMTMVWDLKVNTHAVSVGQQGNYQQSFEYVDGYDNRRFNLLWQGVGAGWGNQVTKFGMTVETLATTLIMAFFAIASGLVFRRSVRQARRDLHQTS
ncbi:MAG: DUF3857 domain-containing transglutaminase family protein [Litoreibacter sp.]